MAFLATIGKRTSTLFIVVNNARIKIVNAIWFGLYMITNSVLPSLKHFETIYAARCKIRILAKN